MDPKSFASDNHSGVHPEIIASLQNANRDHAPAYGHDDWTATATREFEKVFGEGTAVAFTLNGTGANILALSALLTRPYQSVLCSEYAHIYQDETGAPERILGAPLRALPAPGGKLQVADLEKACARLGDPHAVQPQVISLTQSTEYGTVYTTDELKAITRFAHSKGLSVHMDGARIANAAVRLGIGLKELTRDCGIDALSFGGMKNGLMFGECVLLFGRDGKPHPGAVDLPFLRKQATQLDSKMRYIATQYETYLSAELWRKNAQNSNQMAALLVEKISALPGVQLQQKVEGNALFLTLPKPALEKLQKKFRVAIWDAAITEIRLMTSFDTTEADVERFAKALKDSL